MDMGARRGLVPLMSCLTSQYPARLGRHSLSPASGGPSEQNDLFIPLTEGPTWHVWHGQVWGGQQLAAEQLAISNQQLAPVYSPEGEG